MNSFRSYAIGFVFGAIACLAISTNAHTPCNDSYVEQEPDCHYVQAVNPITGGLETHYVCT